MKKVFSAQPIKAADAYVDYNVVVTFGGYIGADEEIVVYAKVGIDKDDLLDVVKEDYADELLSAEVVEFDEDEGLYTVEVNFGGYIGVSEEYEIYADDEDEAIDDALRDATWELDIDSFEVAEDY